MISKLFRKHWPLWSILGVYWLAVLGMAALALHMNQGRLAYVLDDAYIHLAMAKNMAIAGVWGVTGETFTSTTSSPLWTGLLALLFRVFGMQDSYPLWLNLVSGTAILSAAALMLERQVRSKPLQFMILVVLVLMTPLATLALTGMEHSLHLLLSLVFLCLAAGSLADEKPPSLRSRWWLWVLAPLLTATRYEGLFMLLVVCVLFAVRRRFVDALVMGIAGLLPVLAYGLASVRQGWFFLPNSVLLKGRLLDFSPEGVLRLLGYNALEQLKNNSVLLILCVGVLFCCVYGLLQGRGKLGFKEYAAIIYLGSLLLHVQFAQTGWFYRYEAYLVFVGGLILGFYIEDLVREFQRAGVPLKTRLGTLVIALLAFVLAFPFADRALRALLTTSQAMNNIYEQQYQMGRFVQEYYEGESLALNDIGAVTYLADTRLLDLWGLASKEVAQAKLDQAYGPGVIAGLADQHGVRIAIVYDLFFDETGGLPASWDKVGEWRIRNNRVCASDVVAFYAVEPDAKAKLIQNLRDFQAELPPDVEQSGEYLGSEGGS